MLLAFPPAEMHIENSAGISKTRKISSAATFTLLQVIAATTTTVFSVGRAVGTNIVTSILG
jgi:hypothetical protein